MSFLTDFLASLSAGELFVLAVAAPVLGVTALALLGEFVYRQLPSDW